MNWLSKLFVRPKVESVPVKSEPRPESPMQFDPADANGECDLCGAPMSGYGHGDYAFDYTVYLKFRCGASWSSKDPKDLYWLESSQCGKATKLLREARA